MSAAPRRRILTVCKGGHCRAPLAAAILAQLGGDAVETRAAAIKPWHIGEGAHSAMVDVAAQRGYDLTSHRGVQVNSDLLEWADTVLAMDAAVLDALRELAAPEHAAKVRLYLDAGDVPDPWQLPESAFVSCLSTIETGAAAHLVVAA